MYESAFDVEWTELSREDAMFRAYALGVDAALGNDHPQEIERLAAETSRPLVEIAYDEGKSVAEDRLRSDEDSAAQESSENSDREWTLWDDLVETRREDPDAFEMVRVPERRSDLPGALSRPDLLEPADRDVDAIRLPKFLFE